MANDQPARENLSRRDLEEENAELWRKLEDAYDSLGELLDYDEGDD